MLLRIGSDGTVLFPESEASAPSGCSGSLRSSKVNSRPKELVIIHLEGNLRGLKASMRKSLERISRRRVGRSEVVSTELARYMSDLSRQLGRQLGVLIGREGSVRSIVVGDAHELHLPDIGRLRGGVGRFRGLRLVHTHLAGEGLSDDDLNDLALLRLDAIVVLDVDGAGRPGKIEMGLVSAESNGEDFRIVKARSIHDLDFDFDAEIKELEADVGRRVRGSAGKTETERALVIGVVADEERFAETIELVKAAGVEVAGTLRQPRRFPHPKTVVGSGKLKEVVLESMRCGAEVAIFDVDLKPAQARAFEDATGLKAIDRTQLILDIFAQRASSRDGKLQVELAQLRYSLPRLTDKDAGLSRLTGGIGGRGPGETVMEIGRRRLRDRIRALERQLGKLSQQRDLRRRRRRDEEIPILSIVGYTNVGKSTLLNALTNSDIETADQLFMTLDPTSRRLRFPSEGEVIITDTVGFISELPADLVTAFQATLEELGDADLLLHVVDVSDRRCEEKMQAVESLLGELDIAEIPRLTVLNKSDLVESKEARALAARWRGVAVSAVEKRGFRELIAAVEEILGRRESLLKTYDEAVGPAGQS